MTALSELHDSLKDARADVETISASLSKLTSDVDARAKTLAKAVVDHDASLASQNRAVAAYADVENEANANAMQAADRDVRVKTRRRQLAETDHEKASSLALSTEDTLTKAKARVASLEQRIEVEKLRIAAGPEAVHEAVDELALKAAAIAEDLLDVVADIEARLAIAAEAAAKYSKATGEELRPVDRRHAFLAVVEQLVNRGIVEQPHTLNPILSSLEVDAGISKARGLVDGLAQARKPREPAKPEHVAERQRFFAIARQRRSQYEAMLAHEKTEEALRQRSGAEAHAKAQATMPPSWPSAGGRFFDPRIDATARSSMLNARDTKKG